MKKENFISVGLTVLVASAAIIGGAYAFRSFVPDSDGAEKTVRDFYKQWTEHEGSPLMDRIHRDNNLVSPEYADKVDAIIDSFDKGGFDPILCAQDLPERIDFKGTEVDGGKAVVTLDEIFSGSTKTINIHLAKSENGWVIEDIDCGNQHDQNAGADASAQDKVGDYLMQNINDLSPEKAVLGGTFQVGSVKFTGPDTCLVEYEDGHIALEAEVKFRIEGEQVIIDSFKVLDGVGTSDFKKTGNLTEENGIWTLVYEEPGKPALSAVLEFDADSRCADAYKDESCSPIYWKEGDRAQVIGYESAEKVLVRRMSIIGESGKSIDGSAEIATFEECVAAGNEALYPDCIGCKPYCETPEGRRLEESNGS